MGLVAEARRCCCFSMIPFGPGANVQLLYHTMIPIFYFFLGAKWRKSGVFDDKVDGGFALAVSIYLSNEETTKYNTAS